MLQTRTKINTHNVVNRSSKKGYSVSYQEKLDSAIFDAKKSKNVETVKGFLKDVRTW
jgi:hypothetical protein